MRGHLEHKVRYPPYTLYQIISKYIKIFNLKKWNHKSTRKKVRIFLYSLSAEIPGMMQNPGILRQLEIQLLYLFLQGKNMTNWEKH